MYSLVKFLSLWIYPLGISTILICLSFFLLLRNRRRAGLGLLGLAIVNLWVFSTAVVADALIRSLEHEWPDQLVETLTSADAVVVLGGAFSSGNGQWVYPDAGGQVDRYWHAARIYHAGKAPWIIVSGGRAPHLSSGRTEAESGALFLQDMGVPPDSIILDKLSLSTRDHAVYLKRIVEERGFKSLIVVTSARHMRRAVATLDGIVPKMIPVATDFSVSVDPGFTIRRYLPSASALARSTGAIHEIIGYWVYRVVGWA